MLEVATVDFHLLENAKAHHTDKYEVIHEESTPVLRRAQSFKLSITFKNRPFNENMDKLRLLFTHDKKKVTPRLHEVLEDTNITSRSKINDAKDLWSLQLAGQDKNTITLWVRSPPVAAWGTWKMSLKISVKTHPQIETWKCPTVFWLIFNPWMKDDEVFMQETKYLDEYVLNDVGKVYTTSSKKPIGMKWVYGQFASPILKVIKQVIDETDLEEVQLESPVKFSRVLTRMSGIIWGKWSGSFEDGTAPWLWTGSVPIYEEFLSTGVPAKYGQCFVYAAVFTTALRATGIPARNVTNFISSTSGSDTMSINYIFNSKGESIDSPSIWNFHVWNDAWMARPDLPQGYGGWQAIDSMGSGPASLEAIKKGEICLEYNSGHILAECNSDRVRWTKDDEGEFHLVKVDTAYVGRAMLTKQPFIYDPHGDTDYEDVVSLYKEREGSKEERLAMYNAIKQCDIDDVDIELYERYNIPKPMFHIDVPKEDSNMNFELEEFDSVLFGEPFKAVLKIENLGDNPATIEACLGASSIYYNGTLAELIKRENKSITLKPKSVGNITVDIQPVDYAARLVEFTLLKIHCIATVKENNYTWANDYQLHMEMPEIVITSKNDLELNKEGVLLFQFKNLLKTKLTECNITFEAPGIGRNVKISCKDIKSDEDTTIEHKVKPSKSGQIHLNAIFNSKELNFLGGSSVIVVQ